MREQSESGKIKWRGFGAGLFLLSCLCIPPLFFGLGDLPIRIFDEARNIISAIEMSESGNLIVSTYHHEPEMWSSKPPFFTWCMAGSIKAFGLSEFSVRLPSAIAGLLLVLTLFYFTFRISGSLPTSFVGAMVLLCSEGFAGNHTARTADYDTMLTLWSFLSAVLFFLWSRKGKDAHLYLAFFCMALAVLTKSAAAFLTAPGIAVYLLLSKESRKAVFSRKFLLASLLLLIPVLAFYIGREALNPGYLKAVWENEFGGRYFIALENHTQDYCFYAENLITSRMTIWIWPGMLGLLLIPLIKETETRALMIFSSLTLFSILLILSTAGTKLFWYDLPMYPWLAISAGVALNKIVLLQAKKKILKKYNKIKIAILIILIFCIPYHLLLSRNLKPEETAGERDFYVFSHYLQNISKDKDRQETFTIYYTYADFFYEFYQHLNNPPEFRIKKDADFETGERVVHHVPATGPILDSLYLYERLKKIGDYEEVRILSKRKLVAEEREAAGPHR